MSVPLKNSTSSRATARIDCALEKKLVAYVAAAGAAGVSLLSFSQPASAHIVYTPANSTLDGKLNIDLNHDGIPDFLVSSNHISHLFFVVVAPKVNGNAIREAVKVGGAAAGFFGMPVANGEKFVTNTFYSYGVLMAGGYAYGPYSTVFGPWLNKQDRYLGLKFIIQGQVHYGWARMSFGALNPVVLSGYAYETIPNKPILEGHTSGPEEALGLAPADLLAPASRMGSLGLLAQGAPGIAVWRREEEVVEG
ncbi:MAG TPA: hypothetical protein VMH04_22490 [Candidatus Solibacter sp.]|nr:hypothetical protein [Candidatus Solibacter sp.]